MQAVPQPTLFSAPPEPGAYQTTPAPPNAAGGHSGASSEGLPEPLDSALAERLLARCEISSGGCWIWQGSRLRRGGYGRMHFEGRTAYTHRLSWAAWFGEIPAGLEIDHVKARGCSDNACLCPLHLEPISHRDNILRGRSPSAVNALKTHCPSGHPLDESNTYRFRQRRSCKACRRQRRREWGVRRDARRVGMAC